MTQAELAEIIKDAFGCVVWQATGTMESLGSTNPAKFEQALRKAHWRKHEELQYKSTEVVPTVQVEITPPADYAPNDPRLD